jgi:hypothetical protein
MRLKRILLVIAALAVVAAFSSSAFGQCSMCRTALTGSNNALFIRNFNIGVLVLLIPPVTIFCSLFFALKRYKNESEVETSEPDDPIGDDSLQNRAR